MVERRDLLEDLLKRLTKLETRERDGKEDREISLMFPSHDQYRMASCEGMSSSVAKRKLFFPSSSSFLSYCSFLVESCHYSLHYRLSSFPPHSLDHLGHFSSLQLISSLQEL